MLIHRRIDAGVAEAGPPRASRALRKRAWSSGVHRRRGLLPVVVLGGKRREERKGEVEVRKKKDRERERKKREVQSHLRALASHRDGSRSAWSLSFSLSLLCPRER